MRRRRREKQWGSKSRTVDLSTLVRVRLGTFKKGVDPVHVYRAPDGSLITVWQNGAWNGAFGPGSGIALNL
jgi:hypothetical protein